MPKVNVIHTSFNAVYFTTHSTGHKIGNMYIVVHSIDLFLFWNCIKQQFIIRQVHTRTVDLHLKQLEINLKNTSTSFLKCKQLENKSTQSGTFILIQTENKDTGYL